MTPLSQFSLSRKKTAPCPVGVSAWLGLVVIAVGHGCKQVVYVLYGFLLGRSTPLLTSIYAHRPPFLTHLLWKLPLFYLSKSRVHCDQPPLPFE